MTEAALGQLASDGFVVLDRYLNPGETGWLIAQLEAINGEDAPETSARTKRGVVFARRNLLSTDFVRQFIDSEAVCSLVNRISAGLVAVRAILFDKTGGANWTVPWHQDRSIAVCERVDATGFGPWSEKAGVVHVQPPVELLAQMVTLRFNLDACSLDNGPLRVIPGSHRCIWDREAVDRTVERGPQCSCITAAGGVVVMHPLVLHASSPARHKTAHRRVMHVEFGPLSLPGGLRWAMV